MREEERRMFQIELRVAEGVNFPYYVMRKAQLRILPFADPWVWMDPKTDPYVVFAQDYGTERNDLGEVEGVWYDWLSQVSCCCPDDARDSLKYCGGPLLPVAQRILPEYLSRWPDLHAKLTRLVNEAVAETDLSSILCRNERLFGLSYPDTGREIIHLNHFPTMATQKPGPHFVFGLGCLDRPEGLLQAIEREVSLPLLERILTEERVAACSRRIEEITKQDHYVRGYGSLLEALNQVIRAIEQRGAALILSDIGRKPGEQGYQQIVESLFRNRHLWPGAGLIEFVCTSLEGLR
jgi:hypothetical protein